VNAPVPVVAAFDVDGTLTRRDCVRPFLELLAGRRGIVAAPLRRPLDTIRATLGRDRDAIKEIVVGGVFRGRSVADVDAVGVAFAGRVHDELLRVDTLSRLRWHQRSGHRTVLVSASLGPYLRPLGARLGLDSVLCTDVVALDGVYGATLLDGNCRAAEKAVRWRAWLAGNALDDAALWAYGDSSGDRQLLAMAAHPVWVGSSPMSETPA
jgi:phosphatidylglycerophosphatase C